MNKKDTDPSLLREIGLIVGKLVLIGIILVILMMTVFGVVRNSDIGMKQTVKQGDLVVYYRLDKQYIASDIAAVEYDEKIQMRRVIAIAGDIVDVTAEGLTINGSVQQGIENEETLPYMDGITFPITVAEGQVFLLGDDRESAIDSRLYGAVETEDTLGKMVMLFRRREF